MNKFQKKKTKMESDEICLKQRLEELQRDLSKKQKFEDAISALKSLLLQHYPSSSHSIQKLVLLIFFFKFLFKILWFIIFIFSNIWVVVLFCYMPSCDGFKDEVYLTGFLGCRAGLIRAGPRPGFPFIWEDPFAVLYFSG